MNDKLKNAIDDCLSAKLSNLDGLENHVWARIHTRRSVVRFQWFESALSRVLVPKYRFATFALAILLGLMLSEAGKAHLDVRTVSTAQALSLDVFSASPGLLLANLGEERS